jgi:hypothetical protein
MRTVELFHQEESTLTNANGEACQVAVQPRPPFCSDDAGDFKTSVDATWAPLKSRQTDPPSKNNGDKEHSHSARRADQAEVV